MPAVASRRVGELGAPGPTGATSRRVCGSRRRIRSTWRWKYLKCDTANTSRTRYGAVNDTSRNPAVEGSLPSKIGSLMAFWRFFGFALW